MEDFGDIIRLFIITIFMFLGGYAYGNYLGDSTGYKLGCIEGSDTKRNVIIIDNKRKCISKEDISKFK